MFTTRIHTISNGRNMAFSKGKSLEKIQKWLFPSATLENTPVANTLIENSQYFQEHR